MIYLSGLKRAEDQLRHLENLQNFGKRRDDYIVGALGVLVSDARETRNKELEKAHTALAGMGVIGQTILLDGTEKITVKYVSTWHINGTSDSGCEIGIPLVLTDTVEFADADKQREFRQIQRDQFQAKVAAFRERKSSAQNAAERRAIIEEEIVETMDEGFRKAKDNLAE